MRAVFTLAGLTMKEAFRRRIYIAFLLVAALFACVFFLSRPGGGEETGPRFVPSPEMQGQLVVWFGLAMMRFFSAVLGIGLAAGALSGEIDRGLFYVILSKPLRRWQVVLGKWVGLLGLTALNVLLWSLIVGLAAYSKSHTFHWGLVKAGGLTLLYPMMFVTLTLLFSSFTSQVLATVLTLIAIGVGWQEGVMASLGERLELPVLERMGEIAGRLVPIGRLHGWIHRMAEVDLLNDLASALQNSREPVAADLYYVGGYILGALLLTIIIFGRREISG